MFKNYYNENDICTLMSVELLMRSSVIWSHVRPDLDEKR